MKSCNIYKNICVITYIVPSNYCHKLHPLHIPMIPLQIFARIPLGVNSTKRTTKAKLSFFLFWLRTAEDSSTSPQTPSGLRLIDYFPPFSFALSLLFFHHYSLLIKCSITIAVQIEHCNYPACHLIVPLLSAPSHRAQLLHCCIKPAHGYACDNTSQIHLKFLHLSQAH